MLTEFCDCAYGQIKKAKCYFEPHDHINTEGVECDNCKNKGTYAWSCISGLWENIVSAETLEELNFRVQPIPEETEI